MLIENKAYQGSFMSFFYYLFIFQGMFYDQGHIHEHAQLILPGTKKSLPGTKNVLTTCAIAHAQ